MCFNKKGFRNRRDFSSLNQLLDIELLDISPEKVFSKLACFLFFFYRIAISLIHISRVMIIHS